MTRDYFVCLEDYCSILLLSYSIHSGALGSPDLLLSYSISTISLHKQHHHTNTHFNFNPPKNRYVGRKKHETEEKEKRREEAKEAREGRGLEMEEIF